MVTPSLGALGVTQRIPDAPQLFQAFSECSPTVGTGKLRWTRFLPHGASRLVAWLTPRRCLSHTAICHREVWEWPAGNQPGAMGSEARAGQ